MSFRRPIDLPNCSMTRLPTRTWVGLGCGVTLACAAAPGAPSGAKTASTGSNATSTAASPAVAAGGNPFDGARFYVNPAYGAQVEATAGTVSGDVAERVRRAKAFPTAIWLS